MKVIKFTDTKKRINTFLSALSLSIYKLYTPPYTDIPPVAVSPVSLTVMPTRLTPCDKKRKKGMRVCGYA